MREIRFRGKSEHTGEWIYGFGIGKNEDGVWIQTRIDDYSFVYENTIGQFTGFFDCEGNEIYEGDVIYHEKQGKRRVYYPFDERTACFALENIENGMRSYLENTFLYKKIGDIHDK